MGGDLYSADGKVEYLLQQLRQLEDQVGEIKELLKRWKEERGKMVQLLGGSQAKKRAALFD
jgi:hypothetical protein